MLRRSLAVLFAIPLFALPARGQGVATLCKDGTTTTTTGRGTCTGHGGVDKKATKQAGTAAKAEKKRDAKAEKSAQRAATAAASMAAAPAAVPAAAPAAKPATVPARRAAAPARPASTLPAQSAPARAATAHASNTDPTGATAQCKDGTYSRSTNHRGACARHQGVAKWL